MSAGSDGELREAAGQVFNEIASLLHSAREIVEDAIVECAPSQAAGFVALSALLAQAGRLADGSAQACGRCGISHLDRWMLDECTAKAYARLATREEAPNAAAAGPLRVVDHGGRA